MSLLHRRCHFTLLLALACTLASHAQTPVDNRQEMQDIRAAILSLQQRLDRLEATGAMSGSVATTASPTQPAFLSAPAAASQPADVATPILTRSDRTTLDFLNGTTINLGLDGYYAYNFNHPVGRVNLLRPYDVSSNSFSLNQLSLVIEHAPNVAAGQRFGIRTDLQFGQATETLQGGAQNELRPQVYRNIFQAFGTYVAPVGKGLTLDFGKFSSSLGIEGNYTRDQLNYSRAYLFNFLPYYHMGLRASYDLTSKINLTYWLVNGAQQTEDFNGFKSQAFLLNIKPRSNISWNVNYYFGQEQRDTNTDLNPTLPSSGVQPGQPTANITPAPNGREHIFDTYVTWNATKKLTLIGEADYVVNRFQSHSTPAHVTAGAAYARYQLTPVYAAAGRFEYFSDRGGLFSGTTQALKEGTLTLDRRMADGLLLRTEYRRDFSNRPYFLTDQIGVLKNSQSTATLGLIWSIGQKQGSW